MTVMDPATLLSNGVGEAVRDADADGRRVAHVKHAMLDHVDQGNHGPDFFDRR